MLFHIHFYDIHVQHLSTIPVGVVVVVIVELDTVKELDIIVAVVMTANMGTGDPIIRVVTERISLFTTDPQIFPAVIFT